MEKPLETWPESAARYGGTRPQDIAWTRETDRLTAALAPERRRRAEALARRRALLLASPAFRFTFAIPSPYQPPGGAGLSGE
jgi:hypothetical protein